MKFILSLPEICANTWCPFSSSYFKHCVWQSFNNCTLYFQNIILSHYFS